MTSRKVRRLAVGAALLALPITALSTSGSPVSAAPGDFLPQGTAAFTDLTLPYGVAVSATGDVVATRFRDDTTTNAGVLRLSGSTQSTVATGELGSPFGVALDAAGNTYVTDAAAGSVVKVPAGGGPATVLPFSGLSFPTGVAAAPDGAIYVADADNARVLKLVGSTQTTVGFTGLEAPYGVAVDASGAVLVTDLEGDAVHKLDGATQTTLGFTGLDSPLGIAVASDGDVVVTDAGHDRVLELPAAGGTQKVLPFGGLSAPAGVAIAADGGIYVADTNNDRIATLLIEKAPTAPPYAPFASWNAFVNRQYLDLTTKVPTAGERSIWTTTLAAGTSTKGDLVEALRRSTENTANVDPAARLYRAFLGRTPDAGGLEFWVKRRRTGAWTLNRTADHFASSSEFKRKYGTLSNKAFVTRIYTDVLERPADPSGIAYWTRQLDLKRRSRGSVMVGFSESNEYKRKQAENTDVAVAYVFLLGRTPNAAQVSDWVTRQKAGTTQAVLATELLNSPAYAARITG